MFEIIQLARRRLRSDEDYRAMQTYIALRAIDELERRGVSLADRDVLELAAGRGGYSTVLSNKAKSFLANDIQLNSYLQECGIPFMAFDVMRPFPLPSHSIDLIYSSSLIEHVPDPVRLLVECRRVLRNAGLLYLTFPPFYSLAMIGGHAFKPYHLLGERLALRVYNRKHGTRLNSYSEVGNNLSLYPRRIDEIAQLIKDAGFRITDIYTRMSPINTARLPGFLKDLATWHVCYLAMPGEKPSETQTQNS